MSGTCNTPSMQAATNWQIQFLYNNLLNIVESLNTRPSEQRRPLETRPELNPNNYAKNRDWETPCCDVNPTVFALQKLLQSLPTRTFEADFGVSANDVRSGKFGPLSRSALKELEKLDKNQDYRIVSISKEENERMSGGVFWVPQKGGAAIEIESRKEGRLFPPHGSALLEHIDLSILNPKSTNEGISTDALRSGKYGALSPDITKSLEGLPKDKNYNLGILYPTHPDQEANLAWIEKETGSSIVIGPDRGFLVF
ncbi:hypothetical protein [Pseudomonas sp. PSPC3-3]|uniref:hypothetical protein n=1 Tax=unclassified Pseudomonas TaxID=196821 RepID=UPI003CE6DF70